MIMVQYSVLVIALFQSPAAEALFFTGAGTLFIFAAGITGLAVDIFYTAEFLVRIIQSGKDKGFRFYFFNERGWADFLNSILMLLFVSIPYIVIALTLNPDFTGNVFLFIIYSFSSSLRGFRLFKLASILNPPAAGMASRHTWIISSIVIAVMCFSSSVAALCGVRSTSAGLILYSASLVIIAVLGLYYRRYFENNVSNVIRVIDSGMRKKNYNLMAVINERHKNDEVFHLADYYNRIFLPVKMKQILEKDNKL
jgi:hypothetical protein